MGKHEAKQHLHHKNTRGRKSEQGIEYLFEEIMTENFLNLGKEKDTQVQEVQRVPNKMDPKKSTPRHIILKWQSLKMRES